MLSCFNTQASQAGCCVPSNCRLLQGKCVLI